MGQAIAGILVAIIGIGLACLLAWPVELLWNALIPDLFHGPVVTFWQAFGLNLLCGFLFKGGK